MTKPLASMTGYARAAGAAHQCAFQVEIKSVNSRGLDIRLRLAPGLEALEPKIRKLLSQKLTRGAVSISLSLNKQNAEAELVVNQTALNTVLEALAQLSARIDGEQPKLESILGLRGVLETRETEMSEQETEGVKQAAFACVEQCVVDLVIAREDEGERLALVLKDQIDQIETLTTAAETHPSRSREAIAEKLHKQVSDLMDASVGLSVERLHQEAAILATKADIREELDRLMAHISAARELVKNGGAVGRKLDFLSQEFNREANTLCSKSNAVDLTGIGLDLKAVVDQMREQIQNIE